MFQTEHSYNFKAIKNIRLQDNIKFFFLFSHMIHKKLISKQFLFNVERSLKISFYATLPLSYHIARTWVPNDCPSPWLDGVAVDFTRVKISPTCAETVNIPLYCCSGIDRRETSLLVVCVYIQCTLVVHRLQRRRRSRRARAGRSREGGSPIRGRDRRRVTRRF